MKTFDIIFTPYYFQNPTTQVVSKLYSIIHLGQKPVIFIFFTKQISVFPMFRKYDQKQQFLLPLDLEEDLEDFVPENHIARVLNDIVDVVDITVIESTYSKEGCPAYHPKPLLKILLYGYLIGIRSSRKLQQMTQTDTAFMYLAAMQKPDFHTICRFRSTHLGPIKEIFSQVVTFL
ncbi:Mobile element protein [Methanosarcina siciliae T4/M]|uniref:Mobile element protein n=1 Tax=Methanosarcina siciliae T4/M TaxID=1434120 RepID=A0A0E3L9L7_9EURY|nr:Mobile element protein [Methanosarcina siciliae T4/M]